MSARTFDNAWKKYCKSTGLDITAHQLRHGTATLLFEAGVDIYTTQRILGHAQVSTTMEIYTELREKKMQRSVSAFDKYVANSVVKSK